jgi:hypothetical protein
VGDNQKHDAQHENENEAENEQEAEVKGTIAAGSLSGSCGVNFSFKVGSTSVSTNGATQFKDVSCGSLKAGDSVEIKGARQNDGSILAARVERK